MPFSVVRTNTTLPLPVPPMTEQQKELARKSKLLQRLKLNSFILAVITIAKFAMIACTCALRVAPGDWSWPLLYVSSTIAGMWLFYLGFVALVVRKRHSPLTRRTMWLACLRRYYWLTWLVTLVGSFGILVLGLGNDDRLYKVYAVVAIGTIVLHFIFMFFIMTETFIRLLDEK